MTRKFLSAAIVCAAACIARGQGVSPALSFEAATVKSAATPDSGRHLCFSVNPVSYRCTGVTVSTIAFQAYGLKPYQSPAYDGLSAQYDVEARVPEGTKPEQISLMLRGLLAERFKMKSHFEQKQLPVYELTVASSGPKFKEAAPEASGATPSRYIPDSQLSKDAEGFPIRPPQRGSMRIDRVNGLGRITGSAVSLGNLANYLSQQFKMPVIDSTGLNGKYDYAVKFTLVSVNEQSPSAALPGEASTPIEGGGSTIFSALERQLGLKLEKSKSMIDIFVIDHVEPPTAN